MSPPLPTSWATARCDPGRSGGDVFSDVDALLDATERAVVATGILNIWMHPAARTAAWLAGIRDRHPGRMLLASGNSRASLVEATDRADTDVDRARTAARAHLASYLQLPNYTRNLLRTGRTESDGGNDRLVDGVVACGDVDTAVRRA